MRSYMLVAGVKVVNKDAFILTSKKWISMYDYPEPNRDKQLVVILAKEIIYESSGLLDTKTLIEYCDEIRCHANMVYDIPLQNTTVVLV